MINIKRGRKILLCFALTFSVLALSMISCTSSSSDTAATPDVAGTQISEIPKSALIDAQTLQSVVASNHPNLILIGALDSTKGLLPGNISGKPIDGSYTMWRPDYSGAGSTEALSTEVGGFRVSTEQMEELLSKAGATPESTIVVYAADSMHDATRVWWQIKLLGHEDVRYLDGGLNAWLAAGYPSGQGKKLVKEDLKTTYVAPNNLANTMNATTEQVITALENPSEWVVIDTRSIEEWNGEETGSSKGAFGTGRLKGSPSMPWDETIDGETKKLKSVEELTALYADTIQDKKVITFCQSGVRSAHTYFVLTELLGATEVYNYDGSWIEWSYAASEASVDDVDNAIREKVIVLTEQWNDNKKAI